MLQTLLIVLSCVLAVSVAQVTIDPVGAVTVVEGNNLTITCAEVGSPGSAMRLRQDGVQLTNPNIPPNTITTSMRTYSLLVGRTANGNTYDCFSIVSTNSSEEIMLTVAFSGGGGPKGLSAGALAAMVVCSLVFMALGN